MVSLQYVLQSHHALSSLVYVSVSGQSRLHWDKSLKTFLSTGSVSVSSALEMFTIMCHTNLHRHYITVTLPKRSFCIVRTERYTIRLGWIRQPVRVHESWVADVTTFLGLSHLCLQCVISHMLCWWCRHVLVGSNLLVRLALFCPAPADEQLDLLPYFCILSVCLDCVSLFFARPKPKK